MGLCSRCGKRGHAKRACPMKRKAPSGGAGDQATTENKGPNSAEKREPKRQKIGGEATHHPSALLTNTGAGISGADRPTFAGPVDGKRQPAAPVMHPPAAADVDVADGFIPTDLLVQQRYVLLVGHDGSKISAIDVRGNYLGVLADVGDDNMDHPTGFAFCGNKPVKIFAVRGHLLIDGGAEPSHW